MRKIAVAAAAAVSLISLTSAVSASPLAIYVDQNAQWHYINATAATTQGVPGNWFASNFDDSGWSTGNGVFTSSPSSPGSTFGSDLANAGTPYGGVAPAIPSTGTLWDVGYDPYLRIAFNLSAPTALSIWIAIDNGVQSMYLNGVAGITSGINAEGQGFRWENVFDVGSQYTFAGTNILALQLEDHGGSTAFDLVVSSNDDATNPIFSDGPPPTQPEGPSTGVPEPITLSLFGAGLVGAAAMRRRNKSKV